MNSILFLTSEAKNILLTGFELTLHTTNKKCFFIFLFNFHRQQSIWLVQHNLNSRLQSARIVILHFQSRDLHCISNMQGIAQTIAFHGNRVKLAVLQHINTKQRFSWSNLFSASSTPVIHHHGLENTTVAEILRTKGDDDAGALYWCRTDDTVYDAVKNMTQNNIGALVVVKPGDQKLVAGIVTERGCDASQEWSS